VTPATAILGHLKELAVGKWFAPEELVVATKCKTIRVSIHF